MDHRLAQSTKGIDLMVEISALCSSSQLACFMIGAEERDGCEVLYKAGDLAGNRVGRP